MTTELFGNICKGSCNKFDNKDVVKQSCIHGDEGTEPGSTVIYTMTASFRAQMDNTP